ncbi:hypothetical protein K7432_008229 [Basidiobolus ranarum]|uniref:Tyrosinase copper-binding domain-containing protein n=1 Tax=Basidiobolus ranarum TaxID=34480 RepID=A0ABR2WS42_9FUNG
MLVLRTSWVFSLITAISFVATVTSQCSNIAVRKEIRELSTQERQDFIDAVLAINTINGTQGRSTTYATLSQVHVDYFSEAHGTASFFPWHRRYLRNFEIELQKIKPNVVIPYWDWSIDSQDPASSEVFYSNFFGGNGSGNNSCVPNGPFKNWDVYIPSRHCLQRNFNRRGNISSFFSPEALSAIIRGSKNYADLADQIESPPHGTVHVGIGGDMSRTYSSNDPLFWLHHAFVDKIWADWQAMHPSRAYSYGGTNAQGEEAQLDDMMNPFNTQVFTVMSTTTTGLCYRYSNGPKNRNKRQQLESMDNEDDYKLIIPDPLTEEHIMMNNGDVSAVREKEKFLADVVTLYNLLPNYISPVSPARRPDTMQKLERGELGNLLLKIPAMEIRKIQTEPF